MHQHLKILRLRCLRYNIYMDNRIVDSWRKIHSILIYTVHLYHNIIRHICWKNCSTFPKYKSQRLIPTICWTIRGRQVVFMLRVGVVFSIFGKSIINVCLIRQFAWRGTGIMWPIGSMVDCTYNLGKRLIISSHTGSF